MGTDILDHNDGSILMAHRFEIRKNKKGEFVAYFCYNSETMFWTEGYSSKASAKNAIESIIKNGPGAEMVDTTVE
ncbi:DUF1508 domain-containing protein [Croceicoccus mobilis]|uniref:DUF1508 domain-containing protein n=2 Tax=Croceicoccus mobilis TaxID=1703339 RepID=A0A916YQ33_9SPHN|nr:DUF1508 domain-containing protein [Croceicoccus mobilis]